MCMSLFFSKVSYYFPILTSISQKILKLSYEKKIRFFPSKDLIKKMKVEKITTEHLSVVSLYFDSGLKSPCQIIFMI